MADIEIPRGWELLETGRIKKGDKIFRSGLGRFDTVTDPGGVHAQTCTSYVIRRKPAPAKKAAKAERWTTSISRDQQYYWGCTVQCGMRTRALVKNLNSRAEARRLRDAVLAALKGEG